MPPVTPGRDRRGRARARRHAPRPAAGLGREDAACRPGGAAKPDQPRPEEHPGPRRLDLRRLERAPTLRAAGAPRLIETLDRAAPVREALSYARSGPPAPRPRASTSGLVEKVQDALGGARHVRWRIEESTTSTSWSTPTRSSACCSTSRRTPRGHGRRRRRAASPAERSRPARDRRRRHRPRYPRQVRDRLFEPFAGSSSHEAAGSGSPSAAS